MIVIPAHFAPGLELGLVEPAQVIAWADEQIAAWDEPPEWLIELSTVRPCGEEVLRVLRARGADESIDDESFLALLAVGYFRRGWEIRRTVGLLLRRFCYVERSGELTSRQAQIYLIDDELDHSPSAAKERCWNLLRPALTMGDGLVGAGRVD
jgi:hypothetical protein